jgi:hypothetical protein
MEENVLGQRGKSLEDEFFRKEEEKLLERMRAHQRTQVTREELRKATGLADEAALDRLHGLGLSPQSLAALALVPLVEVAWASGGVEPEERKLILQAAKDSGLDASSQELLASWLAHAPDRALLEAWRGYVRTLTQSLALSQRETFKNELLGRARNIAAASGGVLGMGKVSKAEEAMLQELAQAFA